MADFQVELYGVFRRIAQAEIITLQLEKNEVPVNAILEILETEYPAMAEILKVTACAVGDELVNRHTRVTAHMPLALIPPVSGGQ